MAKYKILMTGGGSAGHVTPNLALIPELKKRDFEVKYIGTKDGIEKNIIAKTDLQYFEISSGKLRRYFDIKNFTDPFKVVKGVFDAYSIIRKEKPDVIFSKGGFVSVPVVIGGYLNKVPVVSHESDITPGLANKITLPCCKKICVTFPEAVEHIGHNKAVLTGSPIRKDILKGSYDKGKEICKFNNNKPVILVIGGSLGAKVINDTVRETITTILESYNVVHLCGKGNIDESLKNLNGYAQFEYLNDELPHIFAITNLVISRAGSNSIFEILTLKKPNLLIPLSKLRSRGDQILNAKSFEKSGYSMVVEEEELNANVLLNSLEKLYQNRETYIDNMKKSSAQNGVQKIVEVIESALKTKK